MTHAPENSPLLRARFLLRELEQVEAKADLVQSDVAAARTLVQQIIEFFSRDRSVRSELEQARKLFHSVLDRYKHALAAAKAQNRATKLRIVNVIARAADCEDPRRFGSEVAACCALWKQTGPADGDVHALADEYRIALGKFRAAAKRHQAANP